MKMGDNLSIMNYNLSLKIVVAPKFGKVLTDEI